MEEIAIVLLLIVLGGVALLVGLILAIVTGSARSERLRRLEIEQASLRAALQQSAARVAYLEQVVGVLHRTAHVPVDRAAMDARPVVDSLPAHSEVAVTASEPQVAPRAPEVAVPIAPAAAEQPALLAQAAEALDDAGSAPTSPSQAPGEVGPAPVQPLAAPAPHVPVAAVVPAPPVLEPATTAPPLAAAARGVVAEDPPVPVPAAAGEESFAPEPPVHDGGSPGKPGSAPIPPARPARFDWERWVGVRGAAALGACVLVIAGLYFFKYSIDNGLIPPEARVVLGVLVGVTGIAASEWMLRRSYNVLANWLAGAGVAILYTAFWAAHGVYGILGSPAAAGLMIVVTVTCGVLALRHDAMAIALLGLLGGFVTPVALSTGEDRPFALFGYLLMLDGALLFLARRRSWPILGAFSLLGTAVYQIAWIGARMGPDRVGLAVGILLVFGGAYAVLSPAPEESESEAWKITRAATVLLPFAFGLYFALRDDLGNDLRPLGLMLCVVSLGAAWMARARGIPWASPVAAVAGTLVIAAWLNAHDRAAVAVDAALLPVILAAIFHAFVELEARRPHPQSGPSAARAAAVSATGALVCLVGAAMPLASLDPRPWVAGWILAGALMVRQSFFSGYGELRLWLAGLVAVGFAGVHFMHADLAGFPAGQVFLVALAVITAVGLLSAALLARGAATATKADEVAALVPFGTALYFASRGEIGPHAAPIAVVILMLAAGATAAAMARREASWIAEVAAALGLGGLTLWLLRHPLEGVAAEASLLVCAFSAVFAAASEIARRRGVTLAPAIERSAAYTPLAAIVVLAAVAASPAGVAPWPWVAGWLVIGAMALRSHGSLGRRGLYVTLSSVIGAAFLMVQASHADDAGFPAPAVWVGAGLLAAAGVLGAAFLHRRSPALRRSSRGAALLPLILLPGVLLGSPPPALAFAAPIALAVVTLVASARIGAGGWSLAAVVLVAFVQTIASFVHVPAVAVTDDAIAAAHTALVGQGLWVVLAATWPLIARRRVVPSTMAWRAAALAGPLAFLGLDHAWRASFGAGAIGVLPVLLGSTTFAVAWRARTAAPEAESVRRSALVWLLGVTVASVSVAIPLQLENEWVTVGWALEGVALLALWRRLDHAGLKYVALAHLGAAALRLVANPWVLGYHGRSGVPIFNWLAYTYWLPVLALVGAWALLRDREVSRQRAWEGAAYAKGRPVLAMTAAAAAIVVFFVWENLTIFDAFGTGRAVEVDFARLPARDLTLSLAWAIYALFLLGVGMARRSAALRWVSLTLILVTVGKVFLYDLSHLHDLYRVMSLVGLALSLIVISLAYQRFVFGKREERVA